MYVPKVNCLSISRYSVTFLYSLSLNVYVFYECAKHVIIRDEYVVSMEGKSLLRHAFNTIPPE